MNKNIEEELLIAVNFREREYFKLKRQRSRDRHQQP